MNLDKIVKIVWLIAGVALLLCFAALGFFALGLNGAFFGSSQPSRGVAIDNSTRQALTKTKLEISAEQVVDIGNSPNYIIPVRISYEEINETLGSGLSNSKSYRNDYELYTPSNLIFLDAGFNVTNVLLNRKALIKVWNFPSDDTPHYEEMDYILYDIVFEDTNKNGQLDEGDDSDLYLSALDGSGLTQITQGLTIGHFEFFDAYKTILIRTIDKQSSAAFYKYVVAEKKLVKLPSIDEAAKQIETILRK